MDWGHVALVLSTVGFMCSAAYWESKNRDLLHEVGRLKVDLAVEKAQRAALEDKHAKLLKRIEGWMNKPSTRPARAGQ
jgi:hypothetical protein